MLLSAKSAAIVAITFALVVNFASGVSAAPLGQTSPPLAATQSLQHVQWRGWGWRRGWGHRGWWGPGPVLGGIIIGGALVAAAIAEHRASASAMRACARDFRSFDPRSGTFIDRDGVARVCPYLY
jgi:hypothetical protein